MRVRYDAKYEGLTRGSTSGYGIDRIDDGYRWHAYGPKGAEQGETTSYSKARTSAKEAELRLMDRE